LGRPLSAEENLSCTTEWALDIQVVEEEEADILLRQGRRRLRMQLLRGFRMPPRRRLRVQWL
jgi:hypothetical protein